MTLIRDIYAPSLHRTVPFINYDRWVGIEDTLISVDSGQEAANFKGLCDQERQLVVRLLDGNLLHDCRVSNCGAFGFDLLQLVGRRMFTQVVFSVKRL